MKRFVIVGALVAAVSLVAACADDVVEKSARAVPSIDPGEEGPAWVSIPAGSYFQGAHDHVESVDANYEMMRYLVTNAQFAEYLNDAVAAGHVRLVGKSVVGHWGGEPFEAYRHERKIEAGDQVHVAIDEPGLRLRYEGGRFTTQESFHNHPMVMVSWYGAEAYCRYYGWRLPAEKEWERAARGDDHRAYPWGDTLAKNQANHYASGDPYESVLGKMGGTTPVGFYNGKSHDGYSTARAVSPYGLFDMAGNVWQWVGDDYPYMHYRWMRGGGHGDHAHDLFVWSRNSVGPEHRGITLGFRCARTPTLAAEAPTPAPIGEEPATAAAASP